MKQDKEMTLNDALTYRDASRDSSLDVGHGNNSNGEVKVESDAFLKFVVIYLETILNQLTSSKRFIIVNTVLHVVNLFIFLGIIIFK